MASGRTLIGLCGRRGAGKDTVAEILTDLIDPPPSVLHHADTLKDAANLIYGLTWSEMNDPVLKEQRLPWCGLTPRFILQRLGAEVCRSISKTTWIDALNRQIDSSQDETAIVIPDVRFQNEVNNILAQGGEVWWIDRDGPGYTPNLGDHSSERPDLLTGVKHHLYNCGTLEELAGAVKTLLRFGHMGPITVPLPPLVGYEPDLGEGEG
jgi:hypothetical protein